jgi:hypothetical protein
MSSYLETITDRRTVRNPEIVAGAGRALLEPLGRCAATARPGGLAARPLRSVAQPTGSTRPLASER